jgi:four helix bundle protein
VKCGIVKGWMFIVKCLLLIILDCCYKILFLDSISNTKPIIMKPHKKLNAWIKSFNLVKELYSTTKLFPAEEKFGLISQIRRAAVSVPVNIAEGSARKGKKEFIHFLHISLGSLTELDTLILLSQDLGFIPEEKSSLLIIELDSIGRIIYGLIKKLESNL